MDYSLFELSPNKIGYRNNPFSLKDCCYILKDNNLEISKIKVNSNKNIYEVISSGLFFSKNFSIQIKNLIEQRSQFLINKFSQKNYFFDLFNDVDTENIFREISKQLNCTIIMYTVNLDKFTLNNKIFNKLNNKKLLHILVHQNEFYNLLDIIDNENLNFFKKIFNEKLDKYYLNEDFKFDKNTVSTNNDSKELSFDNNDINYNSLNRYLQGNLSERFLPYNVNILKNKEYLNLLEKIFPKKDMSINLKFKTSNNRKSGYLKFFDDFKGFGFIINNEDNSDLFVHFDDLNKIDIKFDILKVFKKKFKIKFSYLIYEYIGRHNKSKKAIEIDLEEIILLLK